MQAWLDALLSTLQPAAAVLADGARDMDMPALLALAAALGWASGLRLYAVLFMLGLSGAMDWIVLPSSLQLLQHPLMLAASGFMVFVEFFADKIPGLDSVWDLLHAAIRIPGGALLAAGVFGVDNGTMAAVAGLMGGTLAASSFATKATTRAAVNTSPEPFSNIGVSLLEDGLVVGALWLATQHPFLFAVALIIALFLMAWLLITLIVFLKAVFRRIGAWFKLAPAP